jgi:hypothetical protein
LHSAKAKVAQLVEHDLAKVGVASSNLVFRSNPFHKKGFIVKRLTPAQMVELVDTQDLKSCARQRRAGSIPALSTNPDAVRLVVLIRVFLCSKLLLI